MICPQSVDIDDNNGTQLGFWEGVVGCLGTPEKPQRTAGTQSEEDTTNECTELTPQPERASVIDVIAIRSDQFSPLHGIAARNRQWLL
jgi:hypothetical protein